MKYFPCTIQESSRVAGARCNGRGVISAEVIGDRELYPQRQHGGYGVNIIIALF